MSLTEVIGLTSLNKLLRRDDTSSAAAAAGASKPSSALALTSAAGSAAGGPGGAAGGGAVGGVNKVRYFHKVLFRHTLTEVRKLSENASPYSSTALASQVDLTKSPELYLCFCEQEILLVDPFARWAPFKPNFGPGSPPVRLQPIAHNKDDKRYLLGVHFNIQLYFCHSFSLRFCVVVALFAFVISRASTSRSPRSTASARTR